MIQLPKLPPLVLIPYPVTAPTTTTKNTSSFIAGPTLKSAPDVEGVDTLLAAVVPPPELVALGVGTVSGVEPKLLKLVDPVCGVLTGPWPVSIEVKMVLKMVNGIEDFGMTEVIVSV